MYPSDHPSHRAQQRKAWMRRIQKEDPERYAAWMANRARVKREAYARWKLLGLPAKPRAPRIRAESERVQSVRKPKAVAPDGMQMNNIGMECENFVKES